jgi:hypothetical protein
MGTDSPKYEFYEKVQLATSDPTAREINGELGAVLGRTQSESGLWSYAVLIYRTRVCWSLQEEELLPTGEFDERESFFDGASVRIRVDETGSGNPVK